MQNTVVFFDIGGTLLDSPDIFQIITRRLTGRWPDEETYDLVSKDFLNMIEPIVKETKTLPFMNIVELHRKALAILATRYNYPDISSQAADIVLGTYVHQSSFFSEAEPVLEMLKRRHTMMVIASDNDFAGLNMQIPKFGYDRYFSDYCISEAFQAYKPSRGFIDNLKKYIPDDPAGCFFVGDNWVDVESGKRLGIKSVRVDRKKTGNSFGADYVIPNLTELLSIIDM